MLFINNMIEKALLIKIFAQHIGHSTAVMLLLFLLLWMFFILCLPSCSGGGTIVVMLLLVATSGQKVKVPTRGEVALCTSTFHYIRK